MTYVAGDYKVKCFDCGFTFLASELRRHWTGVFKCDLCWEARHPQDFIRAPNTELPPKWTQPEPAEIFIEVPIYTEITPPIVPENPPPNPGGGNETPPPVDPEEPEEPDTPPTDPTPPPNQDSTWLDHNGQPILDQNDQPIWG